MNEEELDILDNVLYIDGVWYVFIKTSHSGYLFNL